jgi:mannose-1-phosphate guanylyltransferase/mannose-6-phosphate isomerase
MLSRKKSAEKPFPTYEAGNGEPSGRADLYALILAGGVGSRFWPFSRILEPKQFINIFGNESLLQNTINRLKGLVSADKVYIITNRSYSNEVKKQIEKFRIPDANIILEPEGKNTAPAIGLCARLILKSDPRGVLIALPADHYIKDMKKFKETIRAAAVCAQDDFLVTIGIRPKKPATGYGYIKIEHRRAIRNDFVKSFKVHRFLEKPSLKKAKEYIKSKSYFWNSGIFVWKAAVFMDELRTYLPDLYSQLRKISAIEDIPKVWPRIKPISVDYGVMEHSKRIALVPAYFDWSDLGSWDTLRELLPKDRDGNVIQADSIDRDSKGICAFSRANRLIATIGLKDLIIADTPDALLVCNKDRAQEVKEIVDRLKSSKRKEHVSHMTDRRPWGSFTILQIGEGFKIKLIEIEPRKRLSLQAHRRRAEHWVVVSGCAKVNRGRDIVYVRSNQSIYIPKGVKHRLENPSDASLKIVEVQTGNYLEEDDIKRFDDDYRR